MVPYHSILYLRSKNPGSGGNLCNKNAPENFQWRGEDGVIPKWQDLDPYDSNKYKRRSRIHGRHSKNHRKHSKIHGKHSKIHGKHSKIHGKHSKIHGKNWKKENNKTST